MINELLTAILANTFTRKQLIKRARILKDYLSFRLFEGGGSFERYLEVKQKDISLYNNIQEEQRWLLSLGESFYQQITPALFNQIFEKIEKEVKNLKILTVYTPRELPPTEEIRIGGWLKQNISKDVIFEVNIDPNLVAGCALSYRGVYRDYSLKQKISENHQMIVDSLKTIRG